ncbi:hypothetical protein FOQG_18124 [Fusarium oxysporum f. sp. raphani 54005]|uniref:Uncharacterized protein n=2 Tax=Fusarium oxysporum TaxID=5507 RepID=X0BEC7_FUSOX|nr:hypothetical protein FOQG_18124 [Fusarium oxysporum f. sp. raphani 54005]SCO92210.1 uncharacterized protein FRV6_16338 [Fusarium oxysporum]
MDPNLELYRSLLHLNPYQRRDRMAHLPRSEVIRVETIIQDEDNAKRLEETIAGRDLVQVALANPSEIKEDGQLKNIVLGRANRLEDENKMTRCITNNVADSSSTLISSIAGFDKLARPFGLDAWKLVYCDMYYVDGGNATLQEIYEARLHEEELQTPAARARDLIRDLQLRKARRNAKWMIPAIERLSKDELKGWSEKDPGLMDRLLEEGKYKEARELLSKPHSHKDILKQVWAQVSPAPPAWLKKIFETGEQFGFVYYKSRELYQTRYNWNSVWNRITYTSSPSGVSWGSIHCQGSDNWMSLHKLETENWPIFSPNEDLAEDDDLRKHFKKYCEENRSKTEEDEKKKKKKRKRNNTEENENLLSPGILRNTFIVIPLEFVSGNLNIQERDSYDPCWVWAYDADWDGSDEVTVDGEKYEGRVKVAKWSLNSWFYAARWEGVSLRDMWLKAQRHPEKYWICYTKELEEWDHEPYV